MKLSYPKKSNINLIQPPDVPVYRKFRGQMSMLNDTTRVQSANPDDYISSKNKKGYRERDIEKGEPA